MSNSTESTCYATISNLDMSDKGKVLTHTGGFESKRGREEGHGDSHVILSSDPPFSHNCRTSHLQSPASFPSIATRLRLTASTSRSKHFPSQNSPTANMVSYSRLYQLHRKYGQQGSDFGWHKSSKKEIDDHAQPERDGYIIRKCSG